MRRAFLYRDFLPRVRLVTSFKPSSRTGSPLTARFAVYTAFCTIPLFWLYRSEMASLLGFLSPMLHEAGIRLVCFTIRDNEPCMRLTSFKQAAARTSGM